MKERQFKPGDIVKYSPLWTTARNPNAKFTFVRYTRDGNCVVERHTKARSKTTYAYHFLELDI
jgi:hypothetical protein